MLQGLQNEPARHLLGALLAAALGIGAVTVENANTIHDRLIIQTAVQHETHIATGGEVKAKGALGENEIFIRRKLLEAERLLELPHAHLQPRHGIIIYIGIDQAVAVLEPSSSASRR